MVIWLVKETHWRRAWPYYPVTESRIWAHKKLRFQFCSVLVENRGFGFGLKTVNSPSNNGPLLLSTNAVQVCLNSWSCIALCHIVGYTSKTLRYVIVPCVTMGSHSFTCHSHMKDTYLYSPLHQVLSFGWYSLRLPTKGWPGWVDLGGWLHTEINVLHLKLNPDTVTHPSTNRARRRLTLLIETGVCDDLWEVWLQQLSVLSK